MNHIAPGSYSLLQPNARTRTNVEVGRLFVTAASVEYWFLYDTLGTGGSSPSGYARYTLPTQPATNGTPVPVNLSFTGLNRYGGADFALDVTPATPDVAGYVTHLQGLLNIAARPIIATCGAAMQKTGTQLLDLFGSDFQIDWGLYAISQGSPSNIVGYVNVMTDPAKGSAETWALCTQLAASGGAGLPAAVYGAPGAGGGYTITPVPQGTALPLTDDYLFQVVVATCDNTFPS